MRPRPNIRLATVDDAEHIARLITALGYPCTKDQMQARLEALAADQLNATFVAEIDGNVVAMIGTSICRIYEEDGPVGRIIALSVSSRFRRHGIGKLLVQTAERWIQSQGASAALANSGFQRQEAHSFYEGVGYSAKGLSFRKEFSQ